jgi:acid stress-induced BolA-like protein IbaG/YrbA
MDISEVRTAIVSAIPDAEIEIAGEGCNFSAIVVSEAFRGLSPVQRQQRVLAALADRLASGALHAISLKTLTPDEPRPAPAPASQAGGLVGLTL